MAESHRSGQSLDRRFTLIRPLGSGGMGEVWLARDEQSGREVAAKILPPDTSESQAARLEGEYRKLSRLVHPNIVPVLGFHRTVAGPVLVMEAVLGADIGSFMGRSPAEVLETLIPVADALAYAHESGIVHRDIKPSNILIDEGGSPRIVDFGIAGLLGADAPTTTPGGGTHQEYASRGYASPEQATGAPPHPADDSWALGALLHVLISGTPPDETGVLDSPWPLPDELRELIDSLRAPSRADRPADMNDIRRRLENLRSLAAGTRPTAPVQSPTPATPKSSPALTPPPRVSPVGPGATVRQSPSNRAVPENRSTRQGTGVRWGTWAAFGVLGLIAILVFFLLPGWVENRSAAAAGETAPGAAAQLPDTPLEPAASSKLAAAGPDAERRTVERAPEPPIELPPPPRAPEPAPLDLPASSSAKAVASSTSVGGPSPFDSAMSEGIAAIARGDYSAARDSFARAKSLDPGSEAANDGLAQAEEAYRREATRRLEASAEEHEQAERWAEALADYEAILALDPALELALDGRARTRERKEVTEGLDLFLGQPARLTSESGRKTAKQLLARAERISPSGKRLQERSTQLASQLAVYSTPVPVVLVSDNLTNVVIYKVGRQGTFTRKELELKPGSYTVVGSRSGYRDVRRRLEVPPGTEPEPLTVRCEEAI